jgi:hypothetical protein
MMRSQVSIDQNEFAVPIQWLVSWRQQQLDIAVERALERLGRQPGWPRAQIQLIQANKNLAQSIASRSANPWRVGLSHFRAVGEAWLGLVDSSQSAQDFYKILPIIVSAVYRQCFQGTSPEAFRPVSADARQFEADLASLDADFRRRAAEQALSTQVTADPESGTSFQGSSDSKTSNKIRRGSPADGSALDTKPELATVSRPKARDRKSVV